MPRILIIEDDKTIVEAMADTFTFHGFEVYHASDGREGYRLFQEKKPDLLILDVMLPGPDGFAICKKIRQENQNVAIIILTAKDVESDKLLGFALGADDYITKPFSLKELVARVLAILKRSKPPATTPLTPPDSITLGAAAIHFKNFTVTRDGVEYPLSPKERNILKLMVSNPDQVIDRNRMIDEIWGDEYFPSPRTIDNFILKLRTKIETDPKNPKHIITLFGIGYKLQF